MRKSAEEREKEKQRKLAEEEENLPSGAASGTPAPLGGEGAPAAPPTGETQLAAGAPKEGAAEVGEALGVEKSLRTSRSACLVITLSSPGKTNQLRNPHPGP